MAQVRLDGLSPPKALHECNTSSHTHERALTLCAVAVRLGGEGDAAEGEVASFSYDQSPSSKKMDRYRLSPKINHRVYILLTETGI